jgi:hypothetical protein
MDGVRTFPFPSFRRKPESILISSGIPIKSKMDPGMRRDDEQKPDSGSTHIRVLFGTTTFQMWIPCRRTSLCCTG